MSPETDLIYPAFRLNGVSVLREGSYSTMVIMDYDGEPHALSLDFNTEQLDQILRKAPESVRETVVGQLRRDPDSPRTIDFEEKDWFFGVRARLGQPDRTVRETFVPLVAMEIL